VQLPINVYSVDCTGSRVTSDLGVGSGGGRSFLVSAIPTARVYGVLLMIFTDLSGFGGGRGLGSGMYWSILFCYWVASR